MLERSTDPVRLACMTQELYDEPTKVVAQDGKVLLNGPDGLDFAFTPEAAIETGERLLDQGMIATGQERRKRLDHRPR